MKKLYKIIFFMSFIITLSLMLTSCDETKSLNFEDDKENVHVHVFNEKYFYNESSHWKECDCGARSEEIQHSFGTKGIIQETASFTQNSSSKQICQICSYEAEKEIPALEHEHTYSTTWSFDEKTHYHQATCKHSNEKKDVENHSYGQWIIVREATELQVGIKKRICDECLYEEEVEIPALDHHHTYSNDWSFDEKTHYHQATCSHINEKKDVENHSYGQWIIVREATELQVGIKKRICDECLYEEEVEIPALDHHHTYSDAWSFDEKTHYHQATCKHSNEKKDVENHSYGQWIIVREATELQVGLMKRICDECFYEEEVEIPALNHHHILPEDWTIDQAPTCDNMGSKSHYCLSCHEKIDSTDIPALGHQFGEWEVLLEPSLSSQGLIIRLCERDKNHSEMINLPLLNSKLYRHHIVEQPTCEEDGLETFEYTIDNQTICIYNRISKTGHELNPNWHFYENNHWQDCLKCHKTIYREEHTFDENAHCTICDYIGDLGTPGLYYILTGDGSSYSVTNYFGSDGIVEIPETYKGLPVTRIGEKSFSNSSVTEVILPSSIQKIGDEAFYHCSKLSKINLPSNLVEIGNKAFSYCYYLSDIYIPDGVRSIGDSAFASCIGLKEIKIPNSVITIGAHAFDACQNALVLTLSNQLISIGSQAFQSCFKVEVVEIPGTVKAIESSAFAQCKALEKVVLSEGVESISNNAFGFCSSLKEIFLPKSLTHIQSGCFYDCDALKAIYYAGTKEEWASLTKTGFNNYQCVPTIYTYSQSRPLITGSYWHYNEENEIEIWSI